MPTSTTDLPRSSAQRRRRPTQAERVAESRTRLLRAATELFAAQGYEATTTGAIAERAGYVRSMVNTRFGGKEGLLSAMLGDHRITELLASRHGAATGIDAYLRIVDRLREFVVEEPVRLRAFLIVGFESVGPSSIPRAAVLKPLADLEKGIVETLRQGIEDGSVAPSLDPVAHATQTVDQGLGMAFRWVAAPEDYDFAARVTAWREELRTAAAMAR